MHMSDALVSPAVGGALWAVAAGAGALSARGVERAADDRRLPFMGVLGAFVFAAQMVNFTIPGTGSSGHLAGGLLLAILLGPGAAFLTMAAVLAVQALFFADGGLLALGCNAVNLGLLAGALVEPLVWRPLAGRAPSRRRIVLASVAAGVAGLSLGAAGVALETAASGVSTLPLGTFALLLLPIHLPIGVVEGLVTAAVVLAVREARPELLAAAGRARGLRPVALALGCAAAIAAGGLSLAASAQPDGLEWAAARAGGEPAAPAHGLHALAARVQVATAFLSGYRLPGAPAAAARPAETSTAGLLGAAVLLGVGAAAAAGLRALRRRPAPPR